MLDKYKMEIYLLYQSEWLATGSGYDNVIGALWVNPSTCQPVGSTIAHEIGHSFQYMVFCDYLLQKGVPEQNRPSADATQGPGWRYGFVSYNSDGSTTYSDIFSAPEGAATFDVPTNSKKLWFVVSGAPRTYERHAWPTEESKADKDTDDNRWPWQAKFTGTTPSGK